jgi:hypothetical protein
LPRIAPGKDDLTGIVHNAPHASGNGRSVGLGQRAKHGTAAQRVYDGSKLHAHLKLLIEKSTLCLEV